MDIIDVLGEQEINSFDSFVSPGYRSSISVFPFGNTNEFKVKVNLKK